MKNLGEFRLQNRIDCLEGTHVLDSWFPETTADRSGGVVERSNTLAAERADDLCNLSFNNDFDSISYSWISSDYACRDRSIVVDSACHGSVVTEVAVREVQHKSEAFIDVSMEAP